MKLDADGFPSALTNTRLMIIAKIISDSRQGAFDRQDPEFGDDAQVLGFRAYKHTIKELLAYSETETGSYLEISDPYGRCTILIEDCAVRFWKSNDPENDTEEKRLILSADAANQMTLFIEPDAEVDRWGLLYQTEHQGLFSTAELVGFNSATKQVMKRKEIRLGEQPSIKISDIRDRLPQAKEVKNGASNLILKSNINLPKSEGSND